MVSRIFCNSESELFNKQSLLIYSYVGKWQHILVEKIRRFVTAEFVNTSDEFVIYIEKFDRYFYTAVESVIIFEI